MTEFVKMSEEKSILQFVQLPLFLFEQERFLDLSNEAKLMYAFLLRRAEWSKMHEWADEDERVYVYYTVEEIMGLLHCGKQKAIRALQELREADLIMVKKQGFGRPNKIYPKRPIEVRKKDFKEDDLMSKEELRAFLKDLQSERQEVRKMDARETK